MPSTAAAAMDAVQAGLAAFDFQPRTRIVFGAGTLARLGELAREEGARRAMLVTDPGLERAGHPQRALDILAKAGVETHLFDGVEENPTTEHVARAVDFAKSRQIDFIIGLGGGSSMDCAKGANFILTNGGEMRDYWGEGKATQPMLPMIAVPTTAGTGSETQSFALISDAKTHAKMACGDKKAAARVALLDPELTVSMPREVAAVTGYDAISHAVESYVSTRATPISRMLSREAWRLLAPNFPRIFERPDDIEVRGAMLLGAALAGLAIENSMLGAAHSCANPLTARYGVTHGKAIAVFLPRVIKLNGDAVGDSYHEFAKDHEAATQSGGIVAHPTKADGNCELDEWRRRLGAAALEHIVQTLANSAGLSVKLRDYGVGAEDLAPMAAEAAKQWTAQFNPRPLTGADFLEIYNAAY